MKNPLKEKSFEFAVRIVKLARYLQSEKKEFVLSKQVLRSGTAIRALYREAEMAESKKDFIHKLAISQKEANETVYWIELLISTNFIDSESYGLKQEATELLKLITSIIKTTKRNLKNS